MAREKTPQEFQNELYSRFVAFAKHLCQTAVITDANSYHDRTRDQRYLKLTWIFTQADPVIIEGNRKNFKMRISHNARFSYIGPPQTPTASAVMWLEMLEVLATETETKREINRILKNGPSPSATILANLPEWVSQARLKNEEGVVAFVRTYPKEFRMDRNGFVSCMMMSYDSLDNSILNILKLANPTDENSRTKNIQGTSHGKLFFKVGWVRERLPNQYAHAGPMSSKSALIEYLKFNPKFLVNQDCVHSAEISRLMPTEQALETEIRRIIQQQGETTLVQVLTFLRPNSKLRVRNENQLRQFLRNKNDFFLLDGSFLRLAQKTCDSGVSAAVEVNAIVRVAFDVESVANLGSYVTEVTNVLASFPFGISTTKLWPRLSPKLRTIFVRHENLLFLTQKFGRVIRAENCKLYLLSPRDSFTKIKNVGFAGPVEPEVKRVAVRDDMIKKLIQGSTPRPTAYICHYLQHITPNLVIVSLKSEGKALLHRQFFSSRETTEGKVSTEEFSQVFALAGTLNAIVMELAQPVHDVSLLVMHAWHGKMKITTSSAFDPLSLTLAEWTKFVEKNRDDFMEQAQSGLGLLKVGSSPHFALSKALRLLVTKVSSKEISKKIDSWSGLELALCKLYRELFTLGVGERGKGIAAASFAYKDPLFESVLLKLLLPAPLNPLLDYYSGVSLPKTKCVEILVTQEGDIVIHGLTGYIWKVDFERMVGLLLVVAADTQYLVQFILLSQLHVGDKVLFTLRAMEGLNNIVYTTVEDLAVIPTTDRTCFLAFLKAGEGAVASLSEGKCDTFEEDLAPLEEEEEEEGGEVVITLPMFESNNFSSTVVEEATEPIKERECLLS